ncbi:MAG: glycoside hydrolase family 88 protein [Marinilabiliaceae bacterium]|nr:glycoside hydrolase family 88 protein [Marinilabiliaceae bacterium]
MKLFIRTLTAIMLTSIVACSTSKHQIPIGEVIDKDLDIALHQSIIMANQLADKENRLPQTLDKNGHLRTCNSSWWVSGFYPGVLWYLYENFNADSIKKQAEIFTARVEDQQYTTDNHDVGFMIFCSFGNGYRLTQREDYLSVIKNAANSLSTRFNPTIGCIRSWDYASWNKQWQYPVIIDNMMNLELLLWSADKFNNDTLKHIAITHADSTISHHFRNDYSSYHVISYDTITGLPELKHTAQGYSHESAWARGQGWGLYGYTMMYRFTKDQKYLDQAINIANFILNHPNLPEDKIPYWDFNAPDIPNAKRDASAAAIICSALIELSNYVNTNDSVRFMQIAEKQIRTLSTPQYIAHKGTNGGFILKHSVGHMPNNAEVDVPLTYSDYYFVESLIKFKNKLK